MRLDSIGRWSSRGGHGTAQPDVDHSHGLGAVGATERTGMMLVLSSEWLGWVSGTLSGARLAVVWRQRARMGVAKIEFSWVGAASLTAHQPYCLLLGLARLGSATMAMEA